MKTSTNPVQTCSPSSDRRVSITCTQCGKVFETKPSHHWRKTCSNTCAGLAKRNKILKPCPECGTMKLTAPAKDPQRCRPCAAVRTGRILRGKGVCPQVCATAVSEEKRKKKLASPEHSALLSSKLAGRKCETESTREFSEKHWKGVKAIFRSPVNQTYRISNITAFVKKNPQLFQPEDIINKHKRGGYACNATLGLSHVNAGIRGTWKGWTISNFLIK